MHAIAASLRQEKCDNYISPEDAGAVTGEQHLLQNTTPSYWLQ